MTRHKTLTLWQDYRQIAWLTIVVLLVCFG